MKPAGNLIIVLFSLLIPGLAIAQDRYFTQTMETPVFYNPAFAGIQQNLRAGFHFRIQYPGIGAGYTALAASADIGMPKINSGVGLLLMNDASGDGSIIRNSINAFYAYDAKINEKSHFRFGLNAAFFQRVYKPGGYFDSLNAGPPQPTKFIPDIGVGVMYYNDQYYLGASVYHITQPDESFVGRATDILWRRYVVQAGGFYNYGTIVLNPYALVMDQNNKFQVLGGANANIKSFTFGMALRVAEPTENSLNFLFGFSKGKIKVGYSYDLSILDGPGSFSGSHELSLVLQLNKPHDTSAIPMVEHLREAY
jgi:type IX secretion system PorP/SprF family membrane protein